MRAAAPSWLLAALLTLVGSAASAQDGETETETDPLSGTAAAPSAVDTASRRPFDVSGYIQPQFDFRYRPQAFPRDRTTFGAGATRTGLILSGSPLGDFSYTFHAVISAGLINAVSGLETVDRDGDGDPDRVLSTQTNAAGIFIERAVIDYQPLAWLQVRLGQMRIPFTIQNQNPNFALMFAERSGPNQFFLSGTDLGGLVSYETPMIKASLGVYNGTGPDERSASVRGVLYAARVDVMPLGSFPFSEVQLAGSDLRLGFGAGVLYFPSERFDDSGFEGINERDLRASLSARLAVAGLYLQAELLRRQQTDNLSSRPVVATGGYAQGSYYLPVGQMSRFGVKPIARFGMTVEDQSFDPRTSLLTEVGAALLWHRGDDRSDTVRLIVQYFGEHRTTEDESAHGLTTQVQLRF